ncbi:fungal-specific transcription factor domain-containing protein [Phyllosticta citribraziliensis]|uniref:Fungal-specific transcription factor domain-containing protein n=1 Tax=Phyllosticta citribraziliensis TaxID=989973 RepID=A0ABR1LZ62_9PEZI
MTAQILPPQAGNPLAFGNPPNVQASLSTHAAGQTNLRPQDMTSPNSDQSRGRRRDREDESADDLDNQGKTSEDATPGNSRKRRRSRKGLDKKFECPHEGCGKSYSRAEHLYRHQLNHNPKQIYYCDFPDCHRSFVRQDLCARHKERHTARGSQLLRKDTFLHNINPIVASAMANRNAKMVKTDNSPLNQPVGDPSYMSQSPANAVGPSARLGSAQYNASMQSAVGIPAPGSPSTRRSSIDAWASTNMSMPDARQRSSSSYGTSQRSSSFDGLGNTGSQFSPHQNSQGFTSPQMHKQGGAVQTGNMSSPFVTGSITATNLNNQSNPASAYSQQKKAAPHLTSLPPPGFPHVQSAHATPQNFVMPANSMDPINNPGDVQMLDNFNPNYSMPVFGGEGYSRSPFAMADDFTAWLFNESSFGPGQSPMAYSSGNIPSMPGSGSNFGMPTPFFGFDANVNAYYNQPAPPHQPMSVNSILDTSLPESALSEEKRQQLLDLVEARFNETHHQPVKKQKEEFLEGNMDDDNHVLSLKMMQTYIGSYWVHFHTQLPILHRPTFNAASCPPLLLLAMMALGASCLEKSFGLDVTTTCAELANFIAWHLRWEIFMDADFRPPAKLWVFQALILLECFEKMYSTRPLHERAHIHHATTLTLMRRGSSLIGRSPLDSPPSAKDSRHGSVSATTAQEEWWDQWITNEATRRAAFAAFVIDSIHATMFGHSAVMVAHEMRLPLPCDEALWSATSAQEVGRVESSLRSNGIKPITFLDGLKKTLSGQAVRTNSFGRTILMAGLLSVSWHMTQRDLQVSSLGASQALGGRDKWRGSLTRAFDFWKQDFDTSLAKNGDLSSPPSAYSTYNTGIIDDNVFESRTVLHHLAHMAMHVDIVDCQIYAGATRLLGRNIGPQDYAAAQRRMKEHWAPSARARDATFYALRFLSQVLLPADHRTASSPALSSSSRAAHQHHHLNAGGGPQTPDTAAGFTYSAREDFLLNRPWVLYFAALIVWAYGFALDGALTAPYDDLTTREALVRDMRGFLRRVGGVSAPDELVKLRDRNACIGLLVLLRDMFVKTRWELLHEASRLLGKCIEMSAPGEKY